MTRQVPADHPWRRFTAMGNRPQTEKLTPEQHSEVAAKYTDGATAKALAAEYRVAESTIRRAVELGGGVLRGRGGQPGNKNRSRRR